MKKVTLIIITAVMILSLVACGGGAVAQTPIAATDTPIPAPTNSPTPVPTAEPTPTPEPTKPPLPDWVSLYEEAVHSVFNVPASENHLDGTLISIAGTVVEVEEVESDSFPMMVMTLKDDEGNYWVAVTESEGEDFQNNIINDKVTIYGNYMGASANYDNYPSVMGYRYSVDGAFYDFAFASSSDELKNTGMTYPEAMESLTFAERNRTLRVEATSSPTPRPTAMPTAIPTPTPTAVPVATPVPTPEPASSELYPVYWVAGGEVYHSTDGCRSLARSSGIQSGTIAQSGKSRGCNNCVR